VLVGVTIAVLLSTAVPGEATTGDHWARIQLTEGLTEDGQWAYATDAGDASFNSIYVRTWSSEPGQAWHFVPIVRPGFYNIYQIRSGRNGWCINRDSIYGFIDVAPCRDTYAQYWQRQVAYGDDYRLASTVTGECLGYRINRYPTRDIVPVGDWVLDHFPCGYQEAAGEIFRDL
jgi:hypothetical protein